MEKGVRSLVLRLLKRLFDEIAEEQLEALALALLELRLRSQAWRRAYKINQEGKFHAESKRRKEERKSNACGIKVKIALP